ncbi:hypothetical protein ASG12_16845 [Williamsia sp. Leaf354]|nr:hypothetical protein ASG12_16845 [Williamsia sp. Leaf354]
MTNMSVNSGGRLLGALAAVGAMVALCAGCGSDDGPTVARTVTVTASTSTGSSVGGDPTAESTTDATTSGADTATAPATAALPAEPPTNGAPALCANTKVTGTVDVVHPSWGPTRVFTVLGKGIGPQPACILAVDGTGTIRWSFADNNGESRWAMAASAPDSNNNMFVTYNPGRYDGIIVLHPTADGFSPIGADYATGPLRYYYAELQGPDASGAYAIKESSNDCEPSCAGGTVTSKILRWNGSSYVG